MQYALQTFIQRAVLWMSCKAKNATEAESEDFSYKKYTKNYANYSVQKNFAFTLHHNETTWRKIIWIIKAKINFNREIFSSKHAMDF